MMTQDDISARAARLQKALRRAYGIRARRLDTALKRAGRRLPRGLRADAQRIVEAQRCGGHPKLLRRVDGAALERAETRLMEHLGSVDRREAIIDRWLGIAGVIAFNLLVVAGLTLVWAYWRGHIG